MKCPNCGYEHGFNNEICKWVEGELGDYFKLSNGMKIVRDVNWQYQQEERELLGCPRCNSVFMGTP